MPADLPEEPVTPDQLEELTKSLEKQMGEAAKQFEFEKAAQLRDRLKALKEKATSTLLGVEQSRSREVEESGGHESSGQQT